MRKLSKWCIPGFILVFILYIVIGLMAPFISIKNVSENSIKSFHIEDYYQASDGCDRAMLLETGIDAWEERIRLFSRAKDRIVLSTFDMREGESTRDLLAVLLERADAGVSIKILVDGISGLLRMEGNPLFYVLSSHPNAEIRLYNRPNLLLPWKTQGRMHDKYILVDDLAYIIGGRNTFDYFIGDYPTDSRSYDREVLVYNTLHGNADAETSMIQLDEYFNGIWNSDDTASFHNDTSLAAQKKVQKQRIVLEQRYTELKQANAELFAPADYETLTLPAGKITLISNPTDIYCKEPLVFYQLTELMKHARQQVVIHTPYAVCNNYMYDTIREITARVPVTMMLNGVENGDNLIASSDFIYNKKHLLDTGVILYEYNGGISYHGKSVVIDDELSLIGSYNFDLRSTYVDTELMLCIQSRELSKELLSHMDDLHKDCRIAIDPANYDTPKHLHVEDASIWQKLLWRTLGFILKPFRVLI